MSCTSEWTKYKVPPPCLNKKTKDKLNHSPIKIFKYGKLSFIANYGTEKTW